MTEQTKPVKGRFYKSALADFNREHPVYSRSRRRPKGSGHYKWAWEYPVAEARIIKHKDREVQCTVRENGKRVKKTVLIPGYVQVVTPR